MTDPHAPRVFISYSHDSEAHRDRVLALAERLRKDGIDCQLDRWVESPPQGWPAWMAQEIDAADFVLVVASSRYVEKSKVLKGVRGGGTRFESVLITQDLYDVGMWNESFIPVLVGAATREEIVKPLRPYTSYRADTEGDYEALYRRLTDQPEFVAPGLGERRELPSRGSSKARGKVNDRETETKPGSKPWSQRLLFWITLLAGIATILAFLFSLVPPKAEQTTDEAPIAIETAAQLSFEVRLLDSVGDPVVDATVELPELGVNTTTDAYGMARFESLDESVGSMVRVRVQGEERFLAVGSGVQTIKVD